MAGADDRLLGLLAAYATDIGLAFQIVDDILDVESTAGALGKTIGKDAAAGKPTYVSFHGLEQSRELAAGCLARARHSLDSAGLLDSRLAEIAGWIVNRTS